MRVRINLAEVMVPRDQWTHGWWPIINWCSRMAQRWGGIVYDDDLPTDRWDWGQALCREMYGEDWMKAADYASDSALENAPTNVIQRAEQWENGDWPEWAWTTKYARRTEEPTDGKS